MDQHLKLLEGKTVVRVSEFPVSEGHFVLWTSDTEGMGVFATDMGYWATPVVEKEGQPVIVYEEMNDFLFELRLDDLRHHHSVETWWEGDLLFGKVVWSKWTGEQYSTWHEGTEKFETDEDWNTGFAALLQKVDSMPPDPQKKTTLVAYRGPKVPPFDRDTPPTFEEMVEAF